MANAPPVASLPMYDWPEVAWATDAIWGAVATRLVAAGIAAPATVDRARSSDSMWRDPGLLLSQTCGLPYATRLRGLVRLVATPTYSVPGCEGPFYSSMIVTRASDAPDALGKFSGRRFACNATDSLSGHLVLRVAMKEAGVDPADAEWIETGSHRASLRAVADETADVASIDAVCWALALRYEKEATSRLKVVATTPLRPGLPFITAAERPDEEVSTIRTTLKDALADASTKLAREALHLTGIRVTDDGDYLPIAMLQRQFG